MNPIVSIIIPRLKGRRSDWLRQAIESVERQTYPDIELLIVESDKTEPENVVIGVNKSCGDIIKLLHDDDWLPDNSVELAVNSMAGYDFIHGQALLSTGQVYVPPTPTTIANELKRTSIHNATVYYRREMFEVPYLIDFDFHIRNLARGKKIGYCPNVLSFYRLHNDQNGGKPGRREWKQKIRNQLIKEYGKNT